MCKIALIILCYTSFYQSCINAADTVTSSENNNLTVTNPENDITATTVSSSTVAVELTWLPEALKDIAYFLRSHKFNEYDRRYVTDNTNAVREYFIAFPEPPLRALHWEVRDQCEPDFIQCVTYLRKKVRNTGLRRSDDTAVVVEDQNWLNTTLYSMQINQTETECTKFRDDDNTRADPFEGPIERFQWRTTASYYMCWYTMQSREELRHLNESSCDNFAYCTDPTYGFHNKDGRANDQNEFACAMYSFCPDPCCPKKHLESGDDCSQFESNPCYADNDPTNRNCQFNRSENTDFTDIVLNRWNVSCQCPSPGFEWSSMFGMCVDIDECTREGLSNCDVETEACVNLPGSYRCACKWGHVWNANTTKCVPSPALALIALDMKNVVVKNEEEEKIGKSIFVMLKDWFGISSALSHYFKNNLALYFYVLFSHYCIFYLPNFFKILF